MIQDHSTEPAGGAIVMYKSLWQHVWILDGKKTEETLQENSLISSAMNRRK
jgi:hypothetical protein